MPVVVFLAYRFFLEGKTQSMLIVSAVTVGVAVQVFVSSLIGGLQSDLIARTVGAQPHIVVESVERTVRRARPVHGAELVLSTVERPLDRSRGIEDWAHVAARLASAPGVRAVAPKVTGAGLVVHGEASESALVIGTSVARWSMIVPVAEHIVAGTASLGSRDVLLGDALATRLGASIGDLVRIETPRAGVETFTVRGRFAIGSKEADARWAIVSLRSGQALFDLAGGATQLDVAVYDIYEADVIARRIAADEGLDTESWMASNTQLLSALRAQASSSQMIQVFVLLSVAMGITSILVVSVVQRQGEIGILRAVGLSRARVVGVFLVQGGAIGLVGSLLGSAIGAALSVFFVAAMRPTMSLQRAALGPTLFLSTCAMAVTIGLLAAALPARRASRLDPVEAIRRG